MRLSSTKYLFVVISTCLLLTSTTFALNESVPSIRADQSRKLLGDGTNVIVGVIDTGVANDHPALKGKTSTGKPRLFAEKNFITYEPNNTSYDTNGHGTGVTSVILSDHHKYKGLAPDAQYIACRVFDSTGSSTSNKPFYQAIAYNIDNHADVVNMSLNQNAPDSNGFNTLDLLADYASYKHNINFAITSGNILNYSQSEVRSPGSSYNCLSVGRTTKDFKQVHENSANSFTADSRMKPDLVAPGTSIDMASHDFYRLLPYTHFKYQADGTSFAAPHVAGLLAQQIDYAKAHNLPTSPILTKATMMNSTNPVKDKSGKLQSPAYDFNDNGIYTVTEPLSIDAGAGQIDGVNLFHQFSPGNFNPGTVPPTGWNLNTTGIAEDQHIDYVIDTPLEKDSQLATTLAWFRHVDLNTDIHNDLSPQSFNVDQLSTLSLQVLKNDNLIAQSISPFDNVQQLRLTIDDPDATYTLRVLGNAITNNLEPYALAWANSSSSSISISAIPEPATILLLLGVSLILTSKRNRTTSA